MINANAAILTIVNAINGRECAIDAAVFPVLLLWPAPLVPLELIVPLMLLVPLPLAVPALLLDNLNADDADDDEDDDDDPVVTTAEEQLTTA